MAGGLNAIHSYSDPGLDKQKVYEYELSVRLRAGSLSYCILDTNTNKFLHLEAWELAVPERKILVPGEPEPADFARIIELLENDLAWLSSEFSHTRVIIDQGKSTLVPQVLFKEEEIQAVYDFNIAGGPHSPDELRHDQLKPLNTCSVYHVPPAMDAMIQKYFRGCRVFHYSTAFIQAIYLEYMNKVNEKTLFVNASGGRMDILRLKGKKLEYYNSFNYNTAEDLMYYLIFVVEQLSLNPENVELVFMGEIDKHSGLSDVAKKYVRNVSFATRNDDFRYSFVFDQLPGQYYFNLLNASLCES